LDLLAIIEAEASVPRYGLADQAPRLLGLIQKAKRDPRECLRVHRKDHLDEEAEDASLMEGALRAATPRTPRSQRAEAAADAINPAKWWEQRRAGG
jgi:hypothetical protein